MDTRWDVFLYSGAMPERENIFPSRSHAVRGNAFHRTLCVLKETSRIRRRAPSGLGHNAEHCNQIVSKEVASSYAWGRLLAMPGGGGDKEPPEVIEKLFRGGEEW